MLHRLDPRTYPVPADPKSLETQVAKMLYTSIEDSTWQRLRPGLIRTLRSPAAVKRVLGSQSAINFKQAGLPFANLTMAYPTDARLTIERPVLSVPLMSIELPPPPPNTPPQPPPVYKNISLVLNSLSCEVETSPKGGSDEMVLTGAAMQAGGSPSAISTIDCGDFDDEHGPVGHDFGQLGICTFSLDQTPNYPKVIFASFILIEPDQDVKDTAKDVTTAVSASVAAVTTLLGVGVIGGGIASIVDTVGNFIMSMIDDDYFPPYGIMLTMNGPNDFGDNQSDRWMTGDIIAHDGKYRIGYQWVLSE